LNLDGKELYALIGVLATGVFGLIIALVTSRLTRGREHWASRRAAKKELLDERRDLYVEAVALINSHIANQCKGDKEYEGRLRNIEARIELLSPKEIRLAFEETANLISAWAGECRAFEPRRMGNMVVITNTTPAMEAHQSKAAELEVEMWAKLEHLKAAMADELRVLEAGYLD
jgi:hypothetical protein